MRDELGLCWHACLDLDLGKDSVSGPGLRIPVPIQKLSHKKKEKKGNFHVLQRSRLSLRRRLLELLSPS
jgi:hypothetical protein